MFFDHLPQQNLIFGHRGARSIAPENTLLALEKVMECGAHSWETDVRMSKDGELVVFHDATLERTTDIATHKAFQNRTNWHVDQFTASELRELDAGSWFLAADPFGTVASGEVAKEEHETIQGQQIPLLREILRFTKRHSFPVNLEIKVLNTPLGDFTVVEKVLDLIRETETMDLVLLSSFRHEYLYQARELSEKIAIAVLAEEEHPPGLIRYLRSLSAVAYHPDEAICDDELIVQLQHAGFWVNSWTVNDMERAREMLRIGAGVITDWPQRLMDP
jgi:glycerophosphoryl diester phosphodiesterase